MGIYINHPAKKKLKALNESARGHFQTHISASCIHIRDFGFGGDFYEESEWVEYVWREKNITKDKGGEKHSENEVHKKTSKSQCQGIKPTTSEPVFHPTT